MEEMPKIPHAVRRGNTYYLRIRIPQDISKAYNNKKEFTKSLKTGDPRSARTIASQEYAKLMEEFERKRLELNPPAPSDENMLSKYSDAQLMLPVLEWLRIREEQDDIAYLKSNKDAFGEEHEQILLDLETEKGFYEDSLKGKVNENYGAGLAEKELKRQEITFDPKSKSFKKISTLFTEAMIENTNKGIHRLKREAVPEYINPRFKHAPSSIENTFHTQSIKFGELIDEFIQNNQHDWNTQSSKKPYDYAFSIFKEIIPESTLVSQITRQDCRKVANIIFDLPPNLRKRYPKEKYTFDEACKKAKANGEGHIHVSTANEYVSILLRLMRYAKDEEYVLSILADKKILRKDDRPNKEKRYPFDKDQLNQIFTAPIFKGCIDLGKGQNKAGSYIPKNSCKYWCPLISLWTGMRMGECLQLEYSDVGIEDEVDVIYIRKTSETKEQEGIKAFEKRVKNKFSVRFVPIHPELKRIGFLDLIKDQDTSENHLIFKDVTISKSGLSHEYSKWFGRTFLKRNVESLIKNKTVFHSFRHNYRDALRRAEIPIEVVCALGGWSPNFGVHAEYGGEQDAKQLYRHIKKIKYPHLDLSHLYVQK